MRRCRRRQDNPDVDLSWSRAGRLSPAPAWAGSDLGGRLNHWVPTRDDLDQYLPLVRDLLLQTAAQTLAKQALDGAVPRLYRWLVLATAWKESCWRQFVRVGTVIKPMQSPVGAVGIMQVLPRVWRGFYEVKGLQPATSATTPWPAPRS